MNSQFFKMQLAASPVVAILRGLSPERTAEVALKCWQAGIRLVEVPTPDDAACDALRAAAELAQGHPDWLIGAGTICSPDQVERATSAGAQFFVAPGVFPAAIAAADDAGRPTLPGVMTPTDVYTAFELGLDVQKLFPADSLALSHIKALHGPFPQIDFLAVGGVTLDNAQQFLDAGAVGVGVGSSILRPGAPTRFAALSSGL